MKKVLKIRRQASPEDKPYDISYIYETDVESATVATALMEISGELDLAWEHSCLQKKCGACAMVINGRPALACDTRLSDCRQDVITIEPLRKFPVIKDLLVDRSVVAEKSREMKAYLSEAVTATDEAEDIESLERIEETVYEASRCIQCGLCLEICPNYYPKGAFAGMAGMVPLAKVLAREVSEESIRTYEKNVYEGCGKSLACRKICPAGLDMELLLSKNNRNLFRRKKGRKKQ